MALGKELAWAALAVVAAMAFTLVDYGRVHAIPAGAAAVPAVALALVARPWIVVATGSVCVGSVVSLYAMSGLGDWSSIGRIAAGIVGVAIAGLLAHVRISRERAAVLQARRTERIQSEATLGRWLGMTMTSSGMGAWEWHVGSRSLRCRGMASLLGLSAERQVSARLWLSLLPDEQRQAWTEQVRRSLDQAVPIQQVQEIRPPGTGASRWLEVRAEPLVDDSGTVTGLAGTALDVTERVIAEQSEREIQALVEAMLASVPLLAAAEDEEALLAEVCRRTRAIFRADTASVWWLEPEGVARLVARVPESPTRIGERAPMAAVLASSSASASSRSHVLRQPDVRDFTTIAPGAPRLAVITPLREAGQPFAYLSLGWHADRPDPSPEWLAVVDRFASRIVLARAMVLARQAQAESALLSERLQRGLEPSHLECKGCMPWRVSTLYRPGVRQLRLGGDFLDTWGFPDGRIGFVLGDVCGHGPEQAALGVMLRAAWTGAVSVRSDEPAAWVEVLQRVLETRRTDEGIFATLVTGVIDPGRHNVRVVGAGHPPPVRVGASSAAALPITPQPAIGILDAVTYHVDEIDLDAGEGLLVFSDGLFEDRDPSTDLGYGGLVALLDRDPPTDEEGLQRLLRVVDQHRTPTDDDIAAVLLSPRPPAATGG